MLLREVAENVSGNQQNIYTMRPGMEQGFFHLLQRLGGRRYEYLEYLSVLENGAEVEALSTMPHENPFLVTEELDDLLSSEFLVPVRQTDHECLRIRIKMFGDLIYSRLAGFKKKELHKITLQYYETVYGNGRKEKTKEELSVLETARKRLRQAKLLV